MIDNNTVQPKTAQGDVAIDPTWSPLRCEKKITFLGGTTDAWGDDGGALDGGAIYTVTGVVRVRVFAECTTLLAGGATIEVGVSSQTAIFLPQETDTQIDAGELWFNNATPATTFILGQEEDAVGNLPEYVLNGNDIILTVSGGNDVDSGVLDFYCLWVPWSSDGSVAKTTT